MKKAEVRSFLETIRYCISLSWQSSKLYTIVRLAVKVFIPINAILVSFILKNIINILTNQTGDTAKHHILLLIAVTVAISLITVVANKAVAYCESMHNDILERYITLNMMDKSLKSDLEMYDNPVFYDKFTSVKLDYYAITYILWNALDCMSALITFISVVCVLSVQNAFYCVLIVLASFPSGIISQRYTKILYQLGLSQMNDERQKMYVYQVASTKGYAQEVRLFNIGDRLKSRYMTIWTAVFKKKKDQVKKKTIYTVILGLLPEIAIGFITVDVAF